MLKMGRIIKFLYQVQTGVARNHYYHNAFHFVVITHLYLISAE